MKKYLATAGEKGTFYKEALALLNKAEEAEQIIPIEPDMVVIPSGHLLMGNIVTRSVNIDSFVLSKFEVTFEEYDLFTDATGRERADDKGWGRGRLPVINITWEDAVAYTVWLSEQTGKSYRLPSETEWEYAARAGSTEERWFSDDIRGNGANCFGCGSQWDDDVTTVSVGSFSANKWGLHDLIGNVSEWMQDDWYYKRHSACGGSWSDDLLSLFWSPCLLSYPPWRRAPDVGFRIARSF